MRSIRGPLPLSSLCVLSLFGCISIAGQTTPTQFETGGVEIAIPVPWNGMLEMGPEKRHFMDQFVPPSNRLIAGFVAQDDLSKVHVADIKAPPRIAMVAVSRQFESRNISQGDFKLIIDSVSKDFNATVSAFAKDNEQNFNRKLQSLDLDNPKIKFAEPISLGCLFSTPDSAGFGTILQASASGGSSSTSLESSLTKVVSVLYIRTRNRVLFAYIFADYKDKDTVIWLRKASQDWVNQVLAANKE